jgi:hypothetical protein
MAANVTHKAKAGPLLTGTEYEASDSHVVTGAAPSDVDYLVGTASAGLSAEIAVGTSPGGELGGTWASPTVDASHSGSTHAATQAAAEATASSALTTHAAAADPHTGYVLESLLDAKGDLITASADNTPAKLTVGADDTILMADAAQATGLKWVAPATPSTQAFGDSAAAGTADTFTRGDHKHAMPADPTAALTGLDFLVGTATGALSAEIVVGTSPGGELGGTWGTPTVDLVHAGATAWADYTPTWTASTTNPTLGSTTIAGRWRKLDSSTCMVQINIVITTGGAWNAGSGTYIFSLPAGITAAGAAGHYQLGSAHVLDNGTTHFAGIVKIAGGATTTNEVIIADAGTNKILTHNQPMTPATGDQINLAVTFEI